MKILRAYTIGYIVSIVLTLVAFGGTAVHLQSGHAVPPHTAMLFILSVLAVAQILVQLIFFLHIRDEEGPRFNLMALIFALFVVVIVVGGTLWIMRNLSHGQAPPPKEFFTDGVVSPQTQND